jgi:hypothetical protein
LVDEGLTDKEFGDLEKGASYNSRLDDFVDTNHRTGSKNVVNQTHSFMT